MAENNKLQNSFQYREQAFKAYSKIYTELLSKFYPAKGSTGFPERNLSVNFSKAYEKVASEDNIFTWFELQIGERSNEHLDAMIINFSTREILLIEAKRYSNPVKKVQEIIDDVRRMSITDWAQELTTGRGTAGKLMGKMDISTFNIYGIVLADIWLEGNTKKSISDLYMKASVEVSGQDFLARLFNCCNKDETLSDLPILHDLYVESPFGLGEAGIESYQLVSLSWKILP